MQNITQRNNETNNER